MPAFGPHDARQAELSRDDGGVRRTAAFVGHDGRHAPHHRLPVRIGDFGHKHFAALDGLQRGDVAHDPHAADADLLANRLSRDQGRARRLQSSGTSAAVAVRGFAECTVSGRAWTIDQVTRESVLGPFDVHRRADAQPAPSSDLRSDRPSVPASARHHRPGRIARVPRPASVRCASLCSHRHTPVGLLWCRVADR